VLERENVSVEFGLPLWSPKVELIECKGQGHPDTLADELAETLSRVYAVHSLEHCSAVLHHNFDKLCLLGGVSEVSYGRGVLTKPIRVLINGRAALAFGGRSLEIEGLLIETTRRFFAERLTLLDPDRDLEIHLNLSTASSPGRVITGPETEQSNRHRWFSPQSLTDLRERSELLANDTSFGTGYAPLSKTELAVRRLADRLTRATCRPRPDWMGTDVKIMACKVGDRLDIIACIPQIARFVPNRTAYSSNLEWVVADCQEWLCAELPSFNTTFQVNKRDRLESDELYLTAIGSSIETGDEGVVGRGNRGNGIITPLRPMNAEGINGKNPIYHVGKVYNVLAMRIARRLSDLFSASVVVNLVSATGSSLKCPWRIIIQTSADTLELDDVCREVNAMCDDIQAISADILQGLVRTC
jgi:S-adenosylmethionine synthetase